MEPQDPLFHDEDYKIDVYPPDYYKESGYKYPLDMLLALRGRIKTIHPQLLVSPKLNQAYNPRQSKMIQVDDKTETIETFAKKVAVILNQISNENFDKPKQKILDLKIDTKEKLTKVVQLIVDKTISQQMFSSLYINLCNNLRNICVSDMSTITGKLKFSDVLINETKLMFKKYILINDATQKSYENEDIDLVKIKDTHNGVIQLVYNLYKYKFVIKDVITMCMTNMSTIIDTCDEKKYNNARDVTMECLITLISLLKEMIANKADFIESLENVKSKYKQYPIRRLRILFNEALKDFF